MRLMMLLLPDDEFIHEFTHFRHISIRIRPKSSSLEDIRKAWQNDIGIYNNCYLVAKMQFYHTYSLCGFCSGCGAFVVINGYRMRRLSRVKGLTSLLGNRTDVQRWNLMKTYLHQQHSIDSTWYIGRNRWFVLWKGKRLGMNFGYMHWLVYVT